MKSILVLISLLFSLSVFASGKISVQPQYFTHSQKVTPMVGLSVYEKILIPEIAYNGWVGYGDQAFESRENVNWFSMKHSIDLQVTNRVTLSPGIQTVKSSKDTDYENRYLLKVSYKLWD
jgi:hypothetical protein